jgi:cytochrome c
MKKLKKILQTQFKNFAPVIGIAIAVAVIATLLAHLLYQPKKVARRGFQIEIAADGKEVVKAEAKPVDLASLMKIADLKRGEKVFKKCASCHVAARGAGHKVGPNLFAVVGRARGAAAGFSYSPAMKAKGGSWDRESINTFITKPKDYLPGTKMAFPGLKKPQDRADVILFLESQR